MRKSGNNKMKCFNCERGGLIAQNVDLTGRRHDEEFVVTVPGLHCDECGFSTIDNDHSEPFTRAVSDAYRTSHGLLTGCEIKNLRALLNMTQGQFAEHLGVGIASIKRWELGLIQDKAMDELIRLKTDPGAARKNLNNLEQKIPQERRTTAVSCDEYDLSFLADQFYSPKATIGQDLSALNRFESCPPYEKLAA